MKGAKIVIIDDDPDILDILEYNLINVGSFVTTFNSPAAGLSYLNTSKPDMLISDWMMPEMNGIELCKKVKSQEMTSALPFIMLTCKGDVKDVTEAFAAGADDYIVKPIKIKLLIDKLAKHLPISKMTI